MITSLRYLGGVHFRAEAIAKDKDGAEQLASEANTFLKIFQTAEVSIGSNVSDPDFKRAMDSIKIDQKDDHAILTAVLPANLIRKLVSEAPTGLSPAKPESPR